MAQAFASAYGKEQVNAYSAGSKPSGMINPKAIASMQEIGIDISANQSKSLQDIEHHAPFDVIVTMGCGDACPWIAAKQTIDWNIPDPRNMDPEQFSEVRDLVADKVKQLLESV